jgi:transcriptional regulator with XRE-family HTH domain
VTPATVPGRLLTFSLGPFQELHEARHHFRYPVLLPSLVLVCPDLQSAFNRHQSPFLEILRGILPLLLSGNNPDEIHLLLPSLILRWPVHRQVKTCNRDAVRRISQLRIAIGESINRRRLEQGISLDELSIMTGVARDFINSIENGLISTSSLELEPVLKLAAALNLNCNETMREPNLNKEKQNEDILTLVKMGEKLTPEQRQRMIEVTKAMFPDIFKNKD